MLLHDLKKDNIPIDSQFLLLNRLSHRIEKTEKELNQVQKQGKEIEIVAKEGELRELLQATQEISEKIAKSDLGKIAEDKGSKSLIKSIGEKEGYVKDRFSKEKEGYVDKNLEDELGKIGGDKGYLQMLGYSIETKGFFRKRTIITDEKRNQVYSCARTEGAARFLKTRGEERVKEDLEKKFKEDIGSDWEDLKTTEINKAIRKEVKSIAGSPEKAEKGIESLYQEARQKLVQEFKEKKLKEEAKSEKEQRNGREKGRATKKEKEIFLNELNKQLAMMEKSGEISLEEAEGKRKSASLIENHFSGYPEFDARIFAMAGIAGNKEIIEEIKKQEAQKREKENEGEARESVVRVINDLSKGEGAFKDLEGIWATDEGIIREFCDSTGISAEHLDSVEGKMRKKGMVYEKRKGIGLIAFFIELMFQLMLSATDGKEKK